MTDYKWFIHGSKTTCANCGKEYIQDMKQEFLDDWTTEYHPDIRILCPKCMPRSSEGRPSSKLKETEK